MLKSFRNKIKKSVNKIGDNIESSDINVFLKDCILNKFGVRLTVRKGSTLFRQLIKYCFEKSPEKISRLVLPQNISDLEFLITNEMKYSPKPVDNFFSKTIEEVNFNFSKKNIIYFRLSKKSWCVIYSEPSSKDDGKQFIDFYIIGKDSYKEILKIRNVVRKELINSNRSVAKTIYVNGEKISSKWIKYSKKEMNDNTLIVKEDVISLIYDYIDNMISVREAYDHIPITVRNKLRAGILFHGKPGTGKSTMASLIAYHYNADLIYINPKNINEADLIEIGSYVTSKVVVVIIDDIDILCRSRDDMETIEERANLTKILQILDGTVPITSNRFCIQIATTNNFEALDTALVRPGRFDLKIELSDLDMNDAKKMCDRFSVDYNILDGEDFPINPAYLQSKAIQAIKKDITLKIKIKEEK